MAPMPTVKVNWNSDPQVDGIEAEVVQVWFFFKQRLMVVMLDVSMACTVSRFTLTQ